MQDDEDAGSVAGGELLCGECIWPMTPLVLAKMVTIRGLESPEDKPAQEAGDDPLHTSAATGRGPLPGDLEVDQRRTAAPVHEDVLAFFEVHVGNIPAMEFVEQLLKLTEERVVHPFIPLKGMAFDEDVDQPGAVPSAQAVRNTFHSVRSGVDGQFVVCEHSAEPGHRQPEQLRGSAELENCQTGRSAIQAGRCKEVMLVRPEVLVFAVRQGYSCGHVIAAQCPQPCMLALLAGCHGD